MPNQGIFFVLFLDLLLLAVAQEIRSVILFVDSLRVEGAMDRKMFIFPTMKIFHKALSKAFHPQVAGQRYEDVSPHPYTGRVKRITR